MTEINKQVSLGTDDCTEIGDTTIYLTDTILLCGYSSNVRDCGFRWQSVNIPKDATITSAKLSTYIMANDEGTLSANVRGIDEDDTATWSSGSRPSQRTKTTATITANAANWNNWVQYAWADIDIASVIQEIVNRAGWSANNALAVVIEDTAGAGTNYARFAAYEYSENLHGAKLDIVYEDVGRTTKNTRSTSNTHPGVMFQTLTGGHGH